jgi:threonine dehydrogenase-like Zn-dependent dehydrogenase
MGLGSQLTPVFWKECVYKELQIVGSRVTLGDYPRALRLMERNRFHPELLVSEVLPLHMLGKAFHLLEEQPERYLKVLIQNA